jgi:hypothetical protein
MCGIENRPLQATKAQDVVVASGTKYQRLLKATSPGPPDRRKQGGNRDDSGRFPQKKSKFPIDKKWRSE